MAPRPSRRSIASSAQRNRRTASDIASQRTLDNQRRNEQNNPSRPRVVSVGSGFSRTLNQQELRAVEARVLAAAKSSIGFKTDAEFRAEAAKIRAGQPGVSARDARQNAVLFLRRAPANQRRALEAEVEGLTPRFLREAEKQLRVTLTREARESVQNQIQADIAKREGFSRQKEREREAFRGLVGTEDERSAARRTRQNRRAAGLDRETSRALNAAEAAARAQIESDPSKRDTFRKVIDFDEAVTDERARELMDVARDSVDEHFDRKENEVKARLALNLKKLNQNFNIFNEENQFFLETQISKLDRDTAESLIGNIDDAQSRGALDSGLLRAAADKIIEARQRTEDFEVTSNEFKVQKQSLARDLGIETAELGSREQLTDLGFERASEEQKRFFDLASLESETIFNAQRRTGAELLPEDPDLSVTERETGRSSITTGQFTPQSLNFTPEQREAARGSGIRNTSIALPPRLQRRVALTSSATPQRSSSISNTARGIITRPAAQTAAGRRIQSNVAARRSARQPRR